ncbi:putative nucleotide-diphospho-sugar transferase [Methyloceanibacter caenitepidi]|uniref:putative nucleotide-diphospho-sugar transferase n=1 Tax=Methyloceanibacter caenitepidi TaxID=1384459 RepID=UPI0005EE2822|nr:putative nucleotide-diphospho-sugar transferase [Methyloceanibacter caenitepidi]
MPDLHATASLEQKLDRARVHGNVVVCVFANRDYGTLLKHWLATAARAGCHKPLVFCFDEETAQIAAEAGASSHTVPFNGDWLGFMRHQMQITRGILALGYAPLASDLDAIWLRDPIPYTIGHPQDMVFSPGTVQPSEAHAAWGNVLCFGYYLLRPTSAVLSMLDKCLPLMESAGDQPVFNRYLLAQGLNFAPTSLYALSFNGNDVLQSRETRLGAAGDLSVALLPNRLFQRLPEPDEPEPLVIHPITPKVEDTKIAHLKEIGLWFEDLVSVPEAVSELR